MRKGWSPEGAGDGGGGGGGGRAGGIVLLGAGGRVARLLLAALPLAAGGAPPLRWLGAGRADWDMLLAPPPAGLVARARGAAVVVNLAGVTSGPAAALAANAALALAAADLARAAGAPAVFHASSVAVYGPGPGPFAETDPTAPAGPYAAAKAAMEAAVAGQPGATVLRIGNVVGADAISRAILAPAPLAIDRCADGKGPRRAAIGPVTLARVILALAAEIGAGRALPGLLNVAAPGLVAMDDLARAAGRDFAWRAPPPGLQPVAAMDLGRLQGLLPAALAVPADPARALWAEWQAVAGGPA